MKTPTTEGWAWSLLLTMLIAGVALVVIYRAFGRSLRITVLSNTLDTQRRPLFAACFSAVLLSVWSGFWIATFGRLFGRFVFIGGSLSFLLAFLIGYMWAQYRLRQAYVDHEATENTLTLAAEVRELDETAERIRLQQTTIPGQPAWKVLLFLASLQALGALAGYVTIRLAT